VTVPLSFSEYQKLAMRTKSKSYGTGDKTSMIVSALGLCGEAGELCDALSFRPLSGKDYTDNVKKELGDIAWYIAHACECFGYPMDDVAKIPEGFVGTGAISENVMAMCASAGKLADIIKKYIAHGHALDTGGVIKHLNEVFLHLIGVCGQFGWGIEGIMQLNIDKLKARYPEGFDANRSINRDDGIHRA
jgi:NTP pyrophosphatase (non-canonical NTP hydrolase)